MSQDASQNFNKWYVIIAIANVLYIIVFYVLMRLFS
jgi:hypothetical protein